jgi:hypothetical protein
MSDLLSDRRPADCITTTSFSDHGVDDSADGWSVVDDTFTTAWALYTANQDIWIGNWADDFFQDRGVPGRSDQPPKEA